VSRPLYSLLIRLVLPFVFLSLALRGVRDRVYWKGWAQRLGFGARRDGARCLWLHAVSLGEMSAAAPLVRALLERHPERPLVLTSATPAGRARAQALFGTVADIRFLPYDSPGGTRRFLRRINPALALIMETELWPNLFHACAERGVPVVLASARLSQRSVSSYRRFSALIRGVFTDNVRIAAQAPSDAARFEQIGAASTSILVLGNVKFDIPLEAERAAEGHSLRDGFGARAVWIAGSTHAGEDEQVLSAHAALLRERPDALLLLVPRHKERFEPVAELLAAKGVPFTRRSGGSTPQAMHQVLLVDTLGELQRLYAAADVAFVGGSLVPIGGHNLLEPAALGLPVLTGPHNANARDIAQLLIEAGAAEVVADAAALGAALVRLLSDPDARARRGAAGRALIEANRGSVARLIELTESLLAPRP
jgi:3-deoxy-D-manno-octulosonic-acid transferase